MDGQIIFYWIKDVLSKPEAPMWAQVAILFITAGIVGWYTIETYRLRKEAQRQTEIPLRPYVILEATREDLLVRNVGNGTAVNVRVGDIKLSKPNEPLNVILNFPETIPILLKGERLPMKKLKSFVNDEVCQTGQIEAWIRKLKPIVDIAKPQEIFRPEITIEFQNVEGQRYFVRERLVYGELEIINFGKL